VDQVEAGQEVQVVLNQTPFYAESGGQIGDRGYLSGEELVIRVTDVKKDGDFFVHFGKVERGALTGGRSGDGADRPGLPPPRPG
jgi:alanyl-tRNA synthetase